MASIVGDAATSILYRYQLFAIVACWNLDLRTDIILAEVAFTVAVIQFCLQGLTGITAQILPGRTRVLDTFGVICATAAIILDIQVFAFGAIICLNLRASFGLAITSIAPAFVRLLDKHFAWAASDILTYRTGVFNASVAGGAIALILDYFQTFTI